MCCHYKVRWRRANALLILESWRRWYRCKLACGSGVLISEAATDETGQCKARWRRISEKFKAREGVGRAEGVSEREKLVCNGK